MKRDIKTGLSYIMKISKITCSKAMLYLYSNVEVRDNEWRDNVSPLQRIKIKKRSITSV